MDMKVTNAPGPDPALEDALIAALGEGLPLVGRPYAEIAQRLGCSEAEVIDGIRGIIADGRLKRFGVIVRHRQLGYRANGMVVWDIPDQRVRELGHCIGQYAFVTLCYQRPRRLPDWPYNLFTMIHGKDRDAVVAQVELIVEQCGLHGIEHDILFSKRCFKQRGASYRARLPAAAQHPAHE
jgi:DNA-binding Lrp family transcriptional regulator